MAKLSKNLATVTKPLSLNQLQENLITKQNELIDAKKGHRLGELTNNRVMLSLRKDIARIHTAIKQVQITESIDLPKEDK